MAPEELITEKFCNERSSNIVEKVNDLKETVNERFEHVNRKLDKLLNGGGKAPVNYKFVLAVIAGVNVFIAGVIELIKALVN